MKPRLVLMIPLLAAILGYALPFTNEKGYLPRSVKACYTIMAFNAPHSKRLLLVRGLTRHPYLPISKNLLIWAISFLMLNYLIGI